MSTLDKLSTFYQQLFDTPGNSCKHLIYTKPTADGTEQMVRVHAALAKGLTIAPALVFVRQNRVCAIKPYEGETFATVPFNGLLVMTDRKNIQQLNSLGKPGIDSASCYIADALPLTLLSENPEGEWIEFINNKIKM